MMYYLFAYAHVEVIAWHNDNVALCTLSTSLSLFQLDYLWFGTAVYTFVLFAVTFKISTDMREWSWLRSGFGMSEEGWDKPPTPIRPIPSHFSIWISIVNFIVFNLIYNGIPNAFGDDSTTPGVYWVSVNGGKHSNVLLTLL